MARRLIAQAPGIGLPQRQIECILPEGIDKKKRKEGPGMNQRRRMRTTILSSQDIAFQKEPLRGKRRRPPKTPITFHTPDSIS
jgi:hypothetical protein